MEPCDYNRFFEGNRVAKWTPEENKRFENAVALFDRDTPDRWNNVAAMIPGKTISDVMKQYQELVEDVSDIEAGLIPIPGYGNNSLALQWVNDHGHCSSVRKRNCSGRGSDHERKKGVPWTEEEHRQFLLGLKKYGKGDWRNIANNFVTTRTPTQVASHAQKYFIRQLLGTKDKKRSSIHDITTVNPTAEAKPPSPDHKHHHSPSCSLDKSTLIMKSEQDLHDPDMNAVTWRATTCDCYDYRFNNPGTTMAFSPRNSSSSTISTSSYEGSTPPVFGVNLLECGTQHELWLEPDDMIF
ncbi:Duplicated homeodomain-like superfamily protein [Dorcoceras hygrometricum]|uniref:Duplicated homeodomain-like superfamily protein n=1 Tax=Dorcoceras hygrometricum TaxID=472368 RepID=A0A2Z7BYF7_9LAMI|nr:Duplicated homeodomain-like superfamily protein [Dorcoceras hygrometricum]